MGDINPKEQTVFVPTVTDDARRKPHPISVGSDQWATWQAKATELDTNASALIRTAMAEHYGI